MQVAQPATDIIGRNDTTVTLPATQVVLKGKGFDRDSQQAVSYSWSKLSGGNVTLANATTANLTVSGLTAGVYNFRLAVTDNRYKFRYSTSNYFSLLVLLFSIKEVDCQMFNLR